METAKAPVVSPILDSENGVLVEGLLDLPTPESMGMVPLVLRDRPGGGFVTGATADRRELTAGDLDELQTFGAFRRITPARFEVSSDDLVGLWIGDAFRANAATLTGMQPEPGRFGITLKQVDQGQLGVGPPEAVYRVLDAWLRGAFAVAIGANSFPIARLMTQVLPNRDETRAALLWTAPDERTRNAELRWWAKLERVGENVTSLESRAEAAIGTVLQDHGLPPIATLQRALSGPGKSLIAGRAFERHLKSTGEPRGAELSRLQSRFPAVIAALTPHRSASHDAVSLAFELKRLSQASGMAYEATRHVAALTDDLVRVDAGADLTNAPLWPEDDAPSALAESPVSYPRKR
jgi:hypothetical protein